MTPKTLNQAWAKYCKAVARAERAWSKACRAYDRHQARKGKRR